MKKFYYMCLGVITACVLEGCLVCYEEPFISVYLKNNNIDTIAAVSRLNYRYVGVRDTILPSRLKAIISSDTIREWASIRLLDYAKSVQMIDNQFDFDTLSIFVISYSTYKTKSWEQIAEDYDILARYDITNENVASRVEGNSGKIILPYPPNEEISDIYTYVP